MDRAKLRLQVFEQTGIKVDVDDPVFALVALNEAVLAETVDRHLERIDAASAELAQHARSAGGLAAAPAPAATAADPAAGAQAVAAGPAAAAIASPATPLVRPIATSHNGFSPREMRLLACAAGIAILSSALTATLFLAFAR